MEIIKKFKSKNGTTLLLMAILPNERHQFNQFIETESGDAYIVLPVPKLCELPIGADELIEYFGSDECTSLRVLDVRSSSLHSVYDGRKLSFNTQ